MAPLEYVIVQEIKEKGAIPFHRFMELALYHPRHGYYASGTVRIGRQGDFITNVSIGPVFARLMATEFAAIWEELGRPKPFTLVEQGADRGDFVHDLLTATYREWPDFHDALEIIIVEPFATNETRQHERLFEWQERGHGKIVWVPDVEDIPNFTGIHFSNELLDAMPIHSVVFRGGEWRERYVNVTCGGELIWEDGPLSHRALPAMLQEVPAVEGYETEINLRAFRWIETVASKLDRGAVLLADYGYSRKDYYHPERRTGTLTGYQNHHRCDSLLTEPGMKDLTAHIDFTALALGAESAGLRLAGFTDQHHFMVALGARLFPDTTDPLTPSQQRERRAYASLMHPGLLGRGFQFVAFTKDWPYQTPFPGFEYGGNSRKQIGL